VILAIIAGALGFRHEGYLRERAALPVPEVQLTSAQTKQWEDFPSFGGVVPTLLYHGIDDSRNYLSVPQTLFAQQMLALHLAGFHTIDVGSYVAHMTSGVPLPKNPILITFDDGELSSYRGADAILARYGFQATMFVVPAWIDAHPAWALQWNELQGMLDSGRWDIQEHAGTGHTHVQIDAAGNQGEFYAYRKYEPGSGGAGGQLESFAAYRQRVSDDVAWGLSQLHQHIVGYKPLAFAIPYSNYGDRATNDQRIPEYFLAMLHDYFPLVVDGDYLDTGPSRPFEQKARFSSLLTYRIQQGPIMNVDQLYCRLSAFTTSAPPTSEYGCQSNVHSPDVGGANLSPARLTPPQPG
jgi:Predicted xylanase/chitin deacetylase